MRVSLRYYAFLFAVAVAVALLGVTTQAFPVSNPEITAVNMRQIPQWHCLRYRRVDLMRRCRNYRMGRRH